MSAVSQKKCYFLSFSDSVTGQNFYLLVVIVNINTAFIVSTEMLVSSCGVVIALV